MNNSTHGGRDTLHGFAPAPTVDLTSKDGLLIPLKTRGEVRASHQLINGYVVALPAKEVSALISVLKNITPPDPTVDLQHLRRVTEKKYLPTHIDLTPGGYEERNDVRFMFLCPTTDVAASTLETSLSSRPPYARNAFPLLLHTLPVPAFAPTSKEQADEWSAKYWPISYKNTNPYGPHPALVARATADIQPDAGLYLTLADKVAKEAQEAGHGEGVGCVIVEKKEGRRGRGLEDVIAVAGDARWAPLVCDSEPGKKGCGNIMAHAVMRAIGMVAQIRLQQVAKAATDGADRVYEAPPSPPAKRKLPPALDEQASKPADQRGETGSIFVDRPLISLEKAFFLHGNLAPNGYLCTDLDIYITHEPCVMCSMAILHSRFRYAVFERRMAKTGAMTAGGGQGRGEGLGYGLFWRPSELNWKFLAWEFEADDQESSDACQNVEETLQP